MREGSPSAGAASTRRLGRTLAVLASVALGACGGGAGDDAEAFCEGAAERLGVFRDDSGLVSPAAIGALRELAVEAPDELADDLETVTEGSSGDEVDRALANIERFLADECGLEVRG